MTDKFPPRPSNHSEAPKGISYTKRRQLLRSGVSASLLLTTIASRSAWGDLCTRSGLNSANLSGRHTFKGCGKSAGYWKNAKWPSALPQSTSFVDVFGRYPYPPANGTTPAGPILYEGKSLFEVIWLQGQVPNTPGNLGLHLVGAYVNSVAYPKIISPKGFVYSPDEIVLMFQGAATATNFRDRFAALRDTLKVANNAFDNETGPYRENP